MENMYRGRAWQQKQAFFLSSPALLQA